MKPKPLTEHQWNDLRYIKHCTERGERVRMSLINSSVLRALLIRGLVNIVITPEGSAVFNEREKQA